MQPKTHITGDPWGRKERLAALGITAAVLALVFCLIIGLRGEAAPVAGGQTPTRLEFDITLHDIECIALRCAAWVEIEYQGVDYSGVVHGWRLRPDKTYTLTATVNGNGKLGKLRIK